MPQDPTLIFPVKGIHDGVGYDLQPPGSTSDAVNVRPFDALKTRLRGGRRPGLSKYLATQVNGNNPIQAMAKLPKSVSFSDTQTAGSEDFSAPLGTTGKGDIGTDFVRGSLSGTNGILQRELHTSLDSGNNRLNFDLVQIGTAYAKEVCGVSFYTTNDITAVIRANGQSTTTNNGMGDLEECTFFGPFIRASDSFYQGIGARFTRSAADQVVLEVFQWTGTTQTVLGSSGVQTLNGSGTSTNDLTIQLQDLGTGVRATVNWPTQSISNLTVEVTTTTYAAQKRGGVLTSPNVSSVDRTDWRILVSMTYTKLAPRSDTISDALNGTDPNTGGSQQFFLPSGWTDARINASTGAVSTTVGFTEDSSNPSDYAAIDDTNDIIDGPSGANNIQEVLVPTAGSIGQPSFKALQNLSSGTDGVGMAALLTDDFKECVLYNINMVGSTDRADTGVMFSGNTGTCRALDAGIEVASDSDNRASTAGVEGGVVCVREDSFLTWDFNGTKFRLYANGIPVLTYTLDAALQAAIVAFQGAKNAPVFQANSGATTVSSDGLSAFRFLSDEIGLSVVDEELLVVSGGVPAVVNDGEVTIPTNNGNILTEDLYNVALLPAYQRVFMADGDEKLVYDASTGVVSQWVATAGSISSWNFRLLALYRGRIVGAGDPTDPHNYIMSAVGDGFDFDTSPTTPSKTQAVAGNLSQAGLIGDIITALIPFGDDVLLFGCDKSIYQMTGDPAAGGSVDLITDKVGILFGRAWAKAPDNTLYFFGTDGVYRYNYLSREMTNITKGKLDLRLRNLDLTTTRTFMEWDFIREQLHVHVMPQLQTVNPNAPTLNTVYVWDSRTDSWWQDTYPSTMGPCSMLAYDGSDPQDQQMLFGSRDGYIRQVDDAALNDDGTAIASRVRYTPLVGQGDAEIMLTKLTPVLAAGSGPVNVAIYTGRDAEAAATAATPRWKRRIQRGGRNPSLLPRVRGHALSVELSDTGSKIWAIQAMSYRVNAAGLQGG